ncbi:chorismate-binding protein [Actinoplanes sp. NEAU-A12]|uniref:Chorismate-binding protein n=1 Tax=Actinoplanes sandaracinus TaxID=3045177 RepID=A0ABT6X0E3_9ACTN|nr:chorismate-binding protein [Actinoplanes sandaracinus]MDI6105427.1 chorismate-binding protein [Actinoplanes sandaracinus]
MLHGGTVFDHSVLPPLARPPGAPADCQARHHVLCAFRWHQGDPGDPAELLAGFLADNGLPVRNLGRTGDKKKTIGDGAVCGAALYVSADAGSVMAGGTVGAPSPVPGIPDVYAVVYGHVPQSTGVTPETRRWSLGPWRDSWSRAEHADAVDRVRAAIGRGDVYQVNVVGHASAAYTGEPGPALRRIAGLAGARYGGVLTGDGWAIATASPETLVEVRDGRVVTRPIKGTRPATEQGRRELLASAKERAEHVMIVDLERNDLARLPGAGPVRVDELFAVREWCGLWQAESVVSAPLDGEVGLAALLRAVCPGGSVTGAPKLAALAEIAALEPVGRGVSMGGLGWLGPGHLDLGLSIRTVAVDGHRVHAWAGGGITADSDPIAEVDEAAAKAAPLRAALRAG